MALRIYGSSENSKLLFCALQTWSAAQTNHFSDVVHLLCKCLKLEKDAHDNLAKNNSTSFKNGPISCIRGGKQSFARNRVLGSKANAQRFTITIDYSLSPDSISLPAIFMEQFSSVTPYVLLNRSPSILEKNVIVVSVLFITTPNDFTCHVNAFVIEGLHADQDGDEVNVYFLQSPARNEMPSFKLKNAVNELLHLSWRYGRRHNLCYKSRYSFSPFHKFLIQKNEDFLTANSLLWRSLSGSVPDKCRNIMELGCSIMRDQVDDF